MHWLRSLGMQREFRLKLESGLQRSFVQCPRTSREKNNGLILGERKLNDYMSRPYWQGMLGGVTKILRIYYLKMSEPFKLLKILELIICGTQRDWKVKWLAEGYTFILCVQQNFFLSTLLLWLILSSGIWPSIQAFRKLLISGYQLIQG